MLKRTIKTTIDRKLADRMYTSKANILIDRQGISKGTTEKYIKIII